MIAAGPGRESLLERDHFAIIRARPGADFFRSIDPTFATKDPALPSLPPLDGPPDQLFNFARQRQAAGETKEAKAIYEKVLSAMPFHAGSMTMLASISYQEGEDLQGEAYLDRAIDIYRNLLQQYPGNIAYRAPLVNLLLARDQSSEAEAQITGLDLPLNPIRATPEEFLDRRQAAAAQGLPSILINTVPKSASESIWNKLAQGLGLAQSHLSVGLYPDCCLVPARVQSAISGGLIAKEHIPASAHNLQVLGDQGLTKVVFHVRDPRQATLSWAHFVHDDVSMRLMGPIWRKVVPPAAVLRADLTQLIDWCIDHYLPQLVDFMRGWTDLEKAPDSKVEVLFLTFETFLTDPHSYFGSVLEFTGIDPALYAEDAVAEVVHLRKGQTEEWRGVFTKAQQQRAWSHIPADLAERFGWKA